MSSPAFGLAPTQAQQRNPRSDVRTRATAAIVLLLVFIGQLLVTFKLNAHDDIEMINRYFDADNAWYLINFETGDQRFGSYGGRNVIHPNVANFIHPIVVLSGKVTGLPLKSVSLAVAPMFAGLRSALVFLTLSTVGFSLADALLATALCSVAFSSVLFGCLPESFVITSAAFALFFFLAAQLSKQRPVFKGLIFTGTLLSSVTITNLVPFTLGLFYLVRGNLRKTLLISGSALLATIVLFVGLTAAHGTFKGIGRKVGQLEEVAFNARSLLIDFPKVIALSLIPTRPNQLIGVDEEGKSKKVQIVRFTYRDDLEIIKRYTPTISAYQRFATNYRLGIGTLALIAIGILLSTKSSPPVKSLVVLSLIQIAFHWILHSFFGLDLMLYSQHWIVPLVIAISCGLTLASRYKWTARVVVSTLLLAASFQTFSVMKLLTEL